MTLTETYNILNADASVDEETLFCQNCGRKVDDSSKPCPDLAEPTQLIRYNRG